MFENSISFEGKRAVGSLREFPLFFGTVLFALEAIGVVCYYFNLFLKCIISKLIQNNKLCFCMCVDYAIGK